MKLFKFKTTKKRLTELENRIFEKKSKTIGSWFFPISFWGNYGNYTEPTIEERLDKINIRLNAILKYLGTEIVHEEKNEFVVKKIKKSNKR